MQNQNIKKIITRVTNPLSKQKRLEKILNAGKEIILERGPSNLNLRALGKKLNMPQGNIYRYIDNKRDLWIAIRFSMYDDFLDQFNKIIENHEGSYQQLFIKFAELFLNFACENYNRFQLIFLLDPPESDKIGKIEREIDPFGVTRVLYDLINQAIQANEIKESEALKCYYAINSILIGAVRNQVPIKKHMGITEPLSLKDEMGSYEDFKKFILKKVQEILESSKP